MRYKYLVYKRECLVCKHMFQCDGAGSYCKTTCSNECRHKLKVINNIKYKQYNKDYQKSLSTIWHVKQDDTNVTKVGHMIETYAHSILPSLGFNDIINLKDFNYNQSGEFRAIKNGKICLIEITCNTGHPIWRHKQFCRTWHIEDFYMIFINREMTKIRVKKVDVYDEAKSCSLSVNEIRSDEEIIYAVTT